MMFAKLIAGLAAVATLLWFGYRAGHDAAEKDCHQKQLQDFETYNEAVRVAREKEQTLAKAAEEERKTTSEKINHLQHTADALRAELRKRPSRPAASGVPTAPSVESDAQWCTPNRLYADDAAVALWFAERAETMKALLVECRTLYEAQ